MPFPAPAALYKAQYASDGRTIELLEVQHQVIDQRDPVLLTRADAAGGSRYVTVRQLIRERDAARNSLADLHSEVRALLDVLEPDRVGPAVRPLLAELSLRLLD